MCYLKEVKLSPKRKSFYNNISLVSWFQYFNALLEREVGFDFDDEDNEGSINRPISEEEVLLAAEMLKKSGTYVMTVF